jgi:hypothetical protein
MLVVMKTASHHERSSADYVIKPRVAHIRWDQLRRVKELVAAGYEAGVESVPAIRGLIEKFLSESTGAVPSPSLEPNDQLINVK